MSWVRFVVCFAEFFSISPFVCKVLLQVFSAAGALFIKYGCCRCKKMLLMRNCNSNVWYTMLYSSSLKGAQEKNMPQWSSEMQGEMSGKCNIQVHACIFIRTHTHMNNMIHALPHACMPTLKHVRPHARTHTLRQNHMLMQACRRAHSATRSPA